MQSKQKDASLELSRFSAVIFDFDGVILDSETAQYEAWIRALTNFNLDSSIVDHLHIVGVQDSEIVKYIVKEEMADLRPRIQQEKNKLFEAMFATGQIKIVDGLENLVKKLSQRYVLAIASNGRPARINSVLTRNKLERYFGFIVTAGGELPPKPNPAIYLEVIRQLNKPPHACVVIEDSIPGLKAAKSANLYSIAITTGLPKVTLEPYADFVINSFDQIT